MLRAPARSASTSPARSWPLALPAAAGAAFGLGLARSLFEWQPQPLALLAGWPGTLAVAAVAAALVATLGGQRLARAPWLALPLALPALHALAPNVDLLRGWALLAGGLGLTLVLLLPQVGANARAQQLGLALCLFLLYLFTLAPAVGEADTFEFQVGIARLGIAHGSGYPLLMLVGKLFSLLPIGGTLAWRANLTSAFFAALAAVLTTRLSRQLGAGRLAALLAGLAFGVSPTLWSRSVEVEAYTLNAALVAGLLLLAFDLAAGHLGRLAPLAFVFGLSLTNHLTTVLLAPALAVAALAGHGSVQEKDSAGRPHVSLRRRLALAFLLCLLGLSVYLYLPLRWPAVNHGQRLSLAQFANIVTGNEAKGAFQWDLPLRDPGRYAIVFDKLQAEYGWPGPAALAFGLSLIGLAALRRLWPQSRLAQASRRWPQVPITRYHLLLLTGLPYLYFALAFNVPDPDFSAFFIPLHLITAALLGAGLQYLVSLAHRAAPAAGARPTSHTPISVFLLTAFSLIPLRSLWHTLPRVDQSGDWAAHRLGAHILAQPLAAGATILADSQKIAPLYYLQVAEGVRPDLDIVVLPDEASYRAALDERIAEGQTVYLGRFLPGLGGGYALRSVGPLAEVAPAGWAEPPGALQPAAEQPAVPGLRLLGYAAEAGAGLAAAAPASLPLTLAWQTSQPIDANLLVSLQLVDHTGRVAWRGPGRVPVAGLYPTNAWRPGEVVTDYYAVPIDHTLAPGAYWLQVGLFPPFAVSDDGWADLAAVTVLPAAEPPAPAHPLRARFGQQWLLGYNLPETAAPGAPVDVILYWLRPPAAAPTITALGETRSLGAWPAGRLAPQSYTLRAPTGDGAFDLEVTVNTGQPARCGWLAPLRPACALPPVRLAGQAAAPDARNFDQQLLLNTAVLETPRAAPGGQVRVTLEWQGLRRMTENYTVFVHLLGPDGQLHGQVDAWPVSGTQATSRWAPGQPVRDPYTISVPADAPPGDYHVEIGLYLLATGQRLPLLNEAGEIIDDRVLLDGLTIVP